jgi:transposase
MMGSDKFQIKPLSLKDLAGLYDVDYRTIKKWIRPFQKEIGKKNGRYYSIAQVKTILEKLGTPMTISLD